MFHFFRVWKSVMHKRGMPRFSVENFSSHSTGKLRRRTILCFRNFLVANKLMDKRGGLSRFSFRNFLSHSAKKFQSGTVLCCASEVFR